MLESSTDGRRCSLLLDPLDGFLLKFRSDEPLLSVDDCLLLSCGIADEVLTNCFLSPEDDPFLSPESPSLISPALHFVLPSFSPSHPNQRTMKV